MGKGINIYKKAAVFLTVLLIGIMVLFAAVPVLAADELPSGTAYEDLQGEIEAYIQENEATTVGLAYAVFDNSGDIAGGYYGYSDKENQVAVDEDTVFEWGSGTKPLVWISVMQLYEAGELDLEADIRQYLPDNFLGSLEYDTPVTMLDLMNHTAGFEDQVLDMNVDEQGYLDTLEEAVSKNIPEQIYEPGTVTAYSNWGTSLAAYIVECVSGMEFYEYVQQNIFEPLGMEHSALASDLSDNEWVQEQIKNLKCYTTEGVLMEATFHYITLYPSGRCASTFNDYAAFAKALLSRSDKLLKEETWDVLYSPTDYFGDTDMVKNYHGLWAVYFNVQTVGHLGKTSGCSCNLLLDLEDNVGMVIMTNQSNESTLSEQMMSLTFGEYSPEKYSVSTDLPTGTYRNTKGTLSGPFKISALLSGLTKDFNSEYWAASTAGDQEIVEFAYMSYYKVSDAQAAFETGTLVVAAAAFIFLAVSLAVRLILAIRRRKKKLEKEKTPLACWSIFCSIIPFVMAVLFLILFSSTTTPSGQLIWLSEGIAALDLSLIVATVFGIVRNIRSQLLVKQKVYNWIIILSMVGIILFVGYWNMYMFWKI